MNRHWRAALIIVLAVLLSWVAAVAAHADTPGLYFDYQLSRASRQLYASGVRDALTQVYGLMAQGMAGEELVGYVVFLKIWVSSRGPHSWQSRGADDALEASLTLIRMGMPHAEQQKAIALMIFAPTTDVIVGRLAGKGEPSMTSRIVGDLRRLWRDANVGGAGQ